ncbi:MAG: DUF2314 domain-containing protein [Anaerolineae bacterium]|nr:DUF2314 domain-containing protein [Anaerolineae bacterium]MBT7069502.1 DUF2314 domain-containing protein [Anaerolineae bacterium]MBT7325533.1 DUF2314 domain-containing protein [Anaerolineae bacterium]
MRKKIFFIVIVGMMLLSCNVFSQILYSEKDNVEIVSLDDSEMNIAIQNAQDSLPIFIEKFQLPNSSQSVFSIKAGFSYGENQMEHIWISNLSFEGKQFFGIVGNEPVYVKNIQLGDEISVQLDSISDWLIIENNQLHGGFTIHVFRNRMNTSEREQFDRDFGVSIPDEPMLP